MTLGGFFVLSDMYGSRFEPIRYFKRLCTRWFDSMYLSFHVSVTFVGRTMSGGGFRFIGHIRHKTIFDRKGNDKAISS